MVISFQPRKMRFSISKIYLRQEEAINLIEKRFGDIVALAVSWQEKADANSNFPKPRDRSTIYRWISDGVPAAGRAGEKNVYGLCALLDVDLLAIFDYRRNGFFSNFAKLRQWVYTSSLVAGWIAPVLAMYRPGEVWPSNAIAQKFYGRCWFVKELTNQGDSQSKDYILLKAKFSEKVNAEPRAVHIAYRRTDTTDIMWRYYGTVVSINGGLELYSEGGHFQKMASLEDDEICFRTYYGGRPVEWRIASLHDFSLTVQRPFDNEGVIGFVW